MSTEANEEFIRRYLLGDLPESAVEEIEKRVLSDDEFADKVQLVEDSLLEDYVDGKLESREAGSFERLLLSTNQGTEEVQLLQALGRYSKREDTNVRSLEPRRADETRSVRGGRWRLQAAAAALIVIALGIAYWITTRKPAPDQQIGIALLNAAFPETRPLESRITVMQGYERYRVTRGDEKPPINELKLDRARLALKNNERQNPNAQSFHELGCYYLANRDFDSAIEWMKRARAADSNSAVIHCDLATAYFEKAKSLPQGASSTESEELSQSLNEYDAALALDGDLADALFNRALVLARMKRNREAVDAWEAYLKRDSSSEWAVEARNKRDEIPR